MILLVHLLFGAAIGSVIKNIPLAILLAFLSHYVLDLLPHIDYPIKDDDKNQWRGILIGLFRVSADFCTGILLIIIFSGNQPMVYVCAFFAVLPDGFTVLKYLFPNIKILKKHYSFHQKIHFLKDNKKISNFWRFASQVAVVIISILLLKT